MDRITDFSVPSDTIRLDNAVFTALSAGGLAAAAFRANTSGLAADATDRIIYEADAGRPWEELATARREGRVAAEGWRMRKNGERYWARSVVTALYDDAGHLRGFAKVTQDMTQQRHLQDLESATRNINEFARIPNLIVEDWETAPRP